MWLLVAMLFLIPIFSAFKSCLPVSGESFADALGAVWTTAVSPTFTSALKFTLLQATVSAVLSALCALPAAYLLYVKPGPSSRVARFTRNAILMPFVLPGVLVVLALMVAYGRNGYLSQGISRLSPGYPGLIFLYGFGGILLTHVFYNISLCVRLVGGAWERLESHLTEAARTLGASGMKAFLTVTWPLIAPNLWYGALLTFIYSALSFAPVLIFGGGLLKTIEVTIYTASNVSFDLREASRMALLQTSLMTLLALAGARLRNMAGDLGEAYSGKGNIHSDRPFSGIRALGGKGYLIALAVFALAPVVGLVLRSLSDPRGYQGLAGGRSLGSLGVGFPQVLAFSAGTALATSAITLVLAYAAASTGNRAGKGRMFRELVFLLPLTVSPITLALGAQGVLGGFPPICGVLAYQVLVAFPIVFPIIQTGLDSFDQRLMDSSRILGATPWKSVWSVKVPVLRTSLISALMYGAAISLGDFVGVLLMGKGELVNLPVAIYRLMGHYNFPQATAIGSILGISVVFIFHIIDTMASHGEEGTRNVEID